MFTFLTIRENIRMQLIKKWIKSIFIPHKEKTFIYIYSNTIQLHFITVYKLKKGKINKTVLF